MPYATAEDIAKAREMDLLTYLQNYERGNDVCHKCRRRDKSVFHNMQKPIVAPYYVNKYQVVDQLDIFDLFFLQTASLPFCLSVVFIIVILSGVKWYSSWF